MFITVRDALDGPRFLINFPTRQHRRSPSQLPWIVDGLQDLRRVIERSSPCRPSAVATADSLGPPSAPRSRTLGEPYRMRRFGFTNRPRITERLQAHRSRQTHPRPRPGSGNGPPPRQPVMTIHNPSEFFPPITTGLPRHPRPDSPRPPATIKASRREPPRAQPTTQPTGLCRPVRYPSACRPSGGCAWAGRRTPPKRRVHPSCG
jgi:hypothetical protein